MSIDASLLEVLQCPACRGRLSEIRDRLLCNSCAREYSVSGGIPDMTFLGPGTADDDLNRIQALHESAVHDQMAESRYEEQIVRIYGTKTRLLAQSWADRIAKMPQPVRVLDYGCGTGQMSRVLSRYCRPLFAADISAASVKKNVADNGVLGCVANGLYLPFKDHAFDVVCLSGVLHHILDLARAAGEITRVSGNFIFVSDMMPGSTPAFGRAWGYPRALPKLLYGTWAVLWLTNAAARKLVGKALAGLVLPKPARAGVSSRFEKPIAAGTAEKLFLENGFIRERLRYWTNLRFPGDHILKRWATLALANETIGTHFEFVFRRKL
jgi:SAM-dependent methyltransferase